MNLAEICIKRPVFTLMMMTALVVLGIFSYNQLGLDLMPKMDFPIVRIYATLPGASPEEMETEIAKPIEEAVNTIGGIDTLTTKCLFGVVQVVVRFNLEKDINIAAQEVRDKISLVVKNFPQGTDPPVVEKLDPDSAPIITLVVSSKMPLRELTFYCKKRIKEPLESIQGVGQIQMVGGREREIWTILDAAKLTKYSISAGQVKDAIANQNLEIPGGNVTNGPDEYTLRTLGRIEDPKKFAEIIVSTQNGIPIRISDLGEVVDGEQEPRTQARLDGKNCLSMVVQKQSGENTLDVIDGINKRLEELQINFPKDLEIIKIRDQSRFIKSSLHELNLHLVLGSLLASLSVLFFMGNIASTLISALAIPVSIISTFLLMKYMGFTLNNMSMLGLTLAVGIVIDDAIVVLENIFRHMEEKKSDAVTAAREATAEIYMAVMATSLSLAVIFVPVAFMYGIIGRLLNNFGLTIAFAILISIFVSFTLTPMLCSVVFQYKFVKGSGHSKSSFFYNLIERAYEKMLSFSLKRRWFIILIALLCILSIKPVGKLIKTDFIPNDDTNEYTIYLRADEGCSLEGSLTMLKEIEAKISKLPGIVHIYGSVGEGASAGVNELMIYVQLKDLLERDFTQFEAMEKAREILKPYRKYRPGVQAAGTSIMSGRNSDLNFFINGPDIDKMRAYSDEIIKKCLGNSNFANAETSLIDPKPEVHVLLDRDRAYRMGVKMEQISNGLRTLVGGQDEISRFKEADELYEVRVRLNANNRDKAEAISALMFPTSNGSMVRLDSIASVSYGLGPSEIDRQDRQRSVMITGNLSSTGALGDVNEFVMKTAKELKMPPEYVYGLTGRAKEMERTKKGFMTAFFMSAIFMYMILASQFESLLHPITIMCSLPLSIPFALFSLFITGNTLNVYSALGVFMLFGIVKKNAILQIDYTNTLRERGLERHKAVMEANLARFRPIIMTTITLVAGMLPMALGKGPGAATRSAMAITVIGGQSLCLLITLLLTPVAYTLFDDLVNFILRLAPKFEKESTSPK
ncbi:MAG: efflux RND transporter permease subunit [Candidatus Riflebacteria bacterium]|nr:efflux RND transporter permease subunit [Candidatus Riflebacteria bacterium]